MKLIQATTRSYFLYAFIAFAIGGLLSFWMVKNALYEEVDEKLYEHLQEVKKALDAGETIPEAWPRKLERQLTLSTADTSLLQWKDSLIFHPGEKEFQPFRQLKSIHSVNGKSHQIVLHASLIEAEDLAEAMGSALALLFVLLLAGLLLINRSLLRKLWTPFFQTLEKLGDFRLVQNKKLALPASSIAEFQQLKAVLEDFSAQAQHDFEAVKAFTENASHEIQTPLAAALLELDLLAQKEGLSEEQLNHIQHTNLSLRRLSRLNEGLLLLAKIENRQFELGEQVALKDVLTASVGRFEELAEAKGKGIEKHFSPASKTITGSSILLEILFDNLLKNALRHSPEGCIISISLNESSFRICNPGQPFQKGTQHLFERFNKENHASDSLGLGLAICQEICKAQQLQLQYEYREGQHCFFVEIDSV